SVVLRVMAPCREPGADIAAARHGRQIIKGKKQPVARQRLHHPESKRGATYAAAGKAQGAARLLKAVNRAVKLGKRAGRTVDTGTKFAELFGQDIKKIAGPWRRRGRGSRLRSIRVARHVVLPSRCGYCLGHGQVSGRRSVAHPGLPYSAVPKVLAGRRS